MQLYSKNHSSDHDEEIEKEFQSMLDDARSTYVIPKAAFDNYRVKRGLREADGSGVTAGVTMISTLVSPETSFPTSQATMTQRNAPAGPAATLLVIPSAAVIAVSISLPQSPTTPEANITRAGARKAYAIATPRTAPVAPPVAGA